MGLHLIPNNLNINFVGRRKLFYALSALVLLLCIGGMALQGGLKYGIDFAGGSIMQVKFEEPVDAEKLKGALEAMEWHGLVVQSLDDDARSYLIRISSAETNSTELRAKVSEAAEAIFNGNALDIQRVESVGPKAGADLRTQAVEALYYATLLIAIYISGRFERRWFVAALMAAGLAGGMYVLQLVGLPKGTLVLLATLVMIVLCWRLRLVYALGSIVSILHDVLITLGIFSLLGKELDLTIIAALLTIVGYSLNDTIIVYDRIRENLRGKRSEALAPLINRSINQTLSRTVLTSLTTLLVVGSLLIFGGGIIHDFALVMFIGIIVGTYSSIFVASPMLLIFGDDLVAQSQKENAESEEKVKRRARALT